MQLVTGDTKVVNRGKGDKIFITTTGIGVIERPVKISADGRSRGTRSWSADTFGDHGMAVMSQRENLEFEGAIESDCAALHRLVQAMLDAVNDEGAIHCLRDPTRGGRGHYAERNRSALKGGNDAR